MVPKVAFKSGVRVNLLALRPEIMKILEVAVLLAPPLHGNVMVVTSQDDGVHSQNPRSRHYVGGAWDLRFTGERDGGIVTEATDPDVIKVEQNLEAIQWADRMQRRLEFDRYTVVCEIDHIHAQWGKRPA